MDFYVWNIFREEFDGMGFFGNWELGIESEVFKGDAFCMADECWVGDATFLVL